MLKNTQNHSLPIYKIIVKTQISFEALELNYASKIYVLISV